MRRASRGSHQFTWRNGPRRMGGGNNNSNSGDRKPLVLSTYLDAQEHLPYADDSAAVTPMSEDNGAIVPHYGLNNLGKPLHLVPYFEPVPGKWIKQQT